jgi:hypothetical protein
MPTGGRWSWKATFDLYLEPQAYITDPMTGSTGDNPDAYTFAGVNDPIFRIATSGGFQANCYGQNSDVAVPADNTIKLYFRCYGDFDNSGVVSAVELEPRQWYAIECEFDGVTRDQIIRVDGIAATANMFTSWYDPVTEENTPWHPDDGYYNSVEFQIGSVLLSNFRIKEFKFYKLEFHPRP